MGAVVGGLYASGLSAKDIAAVANSLNWQDAFHDRPPRTELTFRRKQEDESFLVNFPLGVRNWSFQLPKGLIKGQSLEMLLRRLTLPVATIELLRRFADALSGGGHGPGDRRAGGDEQR